MAPIVGAEMGGHIDFLKSISCKMRIIFILILFFFACEEKQKIDNNNPFSISSEYISDTQLKEKDKSLMDSIFWKVDLLK